MQMHRECIINAGQKLYNRVWSPWVSWGSQHKSSQVAGNYIITTEHWGANSIYDQFITTITVDELINANASKVKQKAKS